MSLETQFRLMAGAFVSIGLLINIPLATAQEANPDAVVVDETPVATESSASVESVVVTEESGEPLESVVVEEVRTEPAADLTAETEGATRLDAVEVTGSRIKRTDFESAQPVLTISRADIERSGLTSIGDLLQDLPQAGAALNTTFNNGGNGSTEIDLRNLGSNRVLVLVNGKRWVGGVSALSTDSVDLNTIPISIIDRIDILKDGASAIYGSDAIAGVVNIITRRDITGTDLSTQFQATDQGDGFTQAHSFSTGTVSGNKSMFLSVGYVKQDEIRAGDREISRVPKFGTGLSRGSPGTDHGFFLFIPTPDNLAIYGNEGCPDDIVILADTSASIDPTAEVNGTAGPVLPGGFLPVIPGLTNENLITNGVPLCILTRRPDRLGQPTDNSPDTFVRYNQNIHAYNFAPDNYLVTPQERTNIFGQFTQQFTDNIGVTAEVLYNLRKSGQELAAFPLQGGALLGGLFAEGGVDMTNPFNPFGQNVGQGTAGNPLVGVGAFFRRINEQGPRAFSQNVDTLRVGAALNGNFDTLGRLFSWDFGYHFTESTNRNIEEGLQNYDRVIKATGPVADCEGASDGCVPLNVFDGPGTITQEMLDYIQYTGISSQRNRQRAFSGNIGTELFSLPAGPLGIATGFEYREQFFASNPDPLVVSGRSTNNAQTPTVGGIDVKEAYVELSIPVLRDWTGERFNQWNPLRYLPVQELEFSIAGRFSDYETFDPATSGKFAVRYKPIDDLLIRASLSDAFRAPSVTELFLGTVESFPSVTDPCSNYNSPARDDDAGIENIRDNCESDGVPSSYSQTSTQVRSQFGGNPLLTPEASTSITGGFVYSPGWLPDFNVDVDWYRIEIEDVITFIGAGQVLALCYGADPSQRILCDRVERGDDGALEGLNVLPGNFSKLLVTGVDLTFSYVLPINEMLSNIPFMPQTDLGSFKLQATGSYTDKYEQSNPGPNGEVSLNIAGLGTGTGAIPRWKAQSSLLWNRGPFEASWTARYIHHTTEFCDDGFQAVTGLFSPADDPVPSFEDFGLCDGRKDMFGIANAPFNKVGSVTYHSLQFGYNVASQGLRMVVGANNIFSKETPVTNSAFANSFDPTLHELKDIVPYFRLVKNFE